MRRRVIIAAVAFLVLCIGFAFIGLRPTPPAGNFPPGFSEVEKREIVSAARRDAMRRSLTAIRHGEFRLAWRWIINARKQTVRSVGNQPGGQTYFHFGIDEPTATDGYAIGARYFMTKTNGHWIILQLF